MQDGKAQPAALQVVHPLRRNHRLKRLDTGVVGEDAPADAEQDFQFGLRLKVHAYDLVVGVIRDGG